MRFTIGSIGVIGRVCAVLLLTVLAVVAANTVFYGQSNRLTLREDEARRAAEHIVVMARILESQTPQLRAQTVAAASTAHFRLTWLPWRPQAVPDSQSLQQMRTRMLHWEPSLQNSELRLWTTVAPDGVAQVSGALQLLDGSWLHFAIPDLAESWQLTLSQLLPTLLPVLMLLAVGLILLRGILQPLRLLVDAVARVGHSDPIVLAEQGPSEFRRLIRAYNAMQARICSMINEKIEALAAVGHDLRTPLARLRLSLDAVEDHETRTTMDRDLLEMEQMLTSLLTYYRGDDHDEAPQAVDIAVMAATIVDHLQDRGYSAAYHGPRHCDVLARPLGIKRALNNLADNARLYGTHTDVTVAMANGEVRIYVADDGPGVPEESLTRILEPFQRLDHARCSNTSGVGLGLTIAARAIRAAGGTLTLSNRATGGLCAQFALPLLEHSAATLRHKAAAS